VSFTVDRLTASTGAIVEGIDLRSVTEDNVGEIEAVLLEHLVLFFPGQALEPAQQKRVAQLFGGIDVAPFGPKHPDVPEMTVLDQEAPKGEGADAWHSDNTFRSEPPKYTMLQSVLLPPTGGDTCWANMYEAYDALSQPMQHFVDGLTATHDLSKTLAVAINKGLSNANLGEMRELYPPEHHPVVRTHPQTGRKALFVNGNFTTRIDDLSDAESSKMLGMLLDHVQSPYFQCRFRWQPGTLALWDNRCLQHYAVPDYTSRRIMHRFTISGDRPF
jgi:taurine dioxygenase